jgi:2-polyprenyl-3-methyl-5-hydroxy-6-metoxy-1,4-benzoquinol methylase
LIVSDAPLAPILADLGSEPRVVRLEEVGDDPPGLDGAGPWLLLVPGHPDEGRLAALRNALWPGRHVSAVYRVGEDGRVQAAHVGGRAELPARATGGPATALAVVSREQALGQPSTRAKFDANAEGWNGMPGSPTYPHYRWMRRLVAQVARPERGQRALDAGCGTGWVGIEAGRLGAMVSAFDPSPAMIELARSNARETGIDLDARVGFVEEVPFERPFTLVLNSGVISFSPDPRVFLERLDRLVEPGGLLVIGDMNPSSHGFRRRRRRRPLLPVREMNGVTRTQAESMLDALGYRIEGRRYYQLTFPVPQLMALSERSARGLGCGALLALNRAASSLDTASGSRAARLFDSWILRARKTR